MTRIDPLKTKRWCVRCGHSEARHDESGCRAWRLTERPRRCGCAGFHDGTPAYDERNRPVVDDGKHRKGAVR